jgi:hypothetical protein
MNIGSRGMNIGSREASCAMAGSISGMSLARTFEHRVRCCDVRDIQDECDTPAILQRVPLLDFAIQIKVDRFPAIHSVGLQEPWLDQYLD